jgi:hypothetical protein
MKTLAAVLFLVAIAPLVSADRASEIDEIREATFRYQFAKNASGLQQGAAVYFLAIRDQAKKVNEDPTDEFMKRFIGNKPRVAKVSEALVSANEGVRDKKTGERGLIFNVSRIRWVSDESVEVTGGYYEAGESASGNTFYVKKKDRNWVVESDKILRVSSSKGRVSRASFMLDLHLI